MSTEITYRLDIVPTPAQIITLYDDAGLNRPTTDVERIGQMYKHANLVVTAWHHDQLVGVARSLTDFCYCCYLSDLAVGQEYQRRGIGQELIALTQHRIGDQTMLLLLSAPPAMEYYPKIGFRPVDNGFIIDRTR